MMRQASEVVSSVLPSALAELVYDGLLGNIDAVLHGSTPQLQWVAREVLALSEQRQAQDDPAERGWEFRLSPDRRHTAIWDPGNQPWFVVAEAQGWWKRDHEVEDWQRFTPAQDGARP